MGVTRFDCISEDNNERLNNAINGEYSQNLAMAA